ELPALALDAERIKREAVMVAPLFDRRVHLEEVRQPVRARELAPGEVDEGRALVDGVGALSEEGCEPGRRLAVVPELAQIAEQVPRRGGGAGERPAPATGRELERRAERRTGDSPRDPSGAG